MSEVDKLLDRIRTHLYLNGDRPIEWFEDFDKLRSGRVTIPQFYRCFENFKFRLNQKEFDLLTERYSDRGMVNYKKFCDETDDIFSNHDLEKDPHATTIDSRKIVATTLGNDIDSIDEKMKPLLRKLAYQVRTRAIHVREAFMDFDPHNNGRVTQSQFYRSLPFKDLNSTELALLNTCYGDPVLKDVNYRKLNLDINKYLEMQDKETSQTIKSRSLQTGLLPHQAEALTVNSRKAAGTVDDVVQRFAKVVREQRIRILDFFQAHDPLNKGLIPRSKFEGTLTVFGFNFTQQEIDYLSESYKEVQGFTEYERYKEFCNDVEELASNASVSSVQTRAVIAPPSESLKRVLEDIKHTVVRFRINVLPTFQAFDRQKRGFITESQFHRALSTLKINVSNPDLRILADNYGSDEGLDYFKFVEDIDPSHSQTRRVFKPIGTDKKSIEDVYGHTPTGDSFITPEKADELIYKSKRGLIKKIDEHKDIQSLIFAMKQWAIVNSVDFTDFFRDFDRHNCGEIPVSNFRSGLSMSTYRVTEDEFDLITEEYQSSTKDNFICWRRFCNDILSAIAPMNLEKEPTVKPEVPSEKYQTRSLVMEPEKEMTPRVERILDNVARFVKCRRLSLVEQFKDKDRLNHKRTTATGFAQVIQLIGVHISKDEIDTLCGFYNDPNTNFVDYVRFCEDVDTRTGQIFGDSAQNSIVIKPIPKYSKEDSPYIVSACTFKPNSEWDEVLKRLQTFVYKRQIRINDFFTAFDRLNKGKVTQQKFQSVIGQTSLPLTTEQIETVALRFTPVGEPDMFDYRSFCKEINAIFGQTELQKKPMDQDDSKVSALPDPSATLQKLSAAEEAKCEAIIKRMHTDVVTKRMNIEEQFMDYDRAPRKNYITKQQFKQCIARLGLSTNPHEFDVLCKKYRCTDLDDMNYNAFCSDIEGGHMI